MNVLSPAVCTVINKFIKLPHNVRIKTQLPLIGSTHLLSIKLDFSR